MAVEEITDGVRSLTVEGETPGGGRRRGAEEGRRQQQPHPGVQHQEAPLLLCQPRQEVHAAARRCRALRARDGHCNSCDCCGDSEE
ncbi:hypothetical protein GUJ93_ZPchr0001g30940 [Zizania palustris]|uniref:Uncharacterized protein n=1 Tax=Zizania palustris TaxID=103762 RepID=A0A8J5S1J6_ZIZPA|nr:hypothetical protein GUJ93_ZPchr0001g30940 [Zizania palustris]KAG8053276.1 hypothetical protein GUJ93_ZPchr0001g30940 [Zizania palustris]